MSERKAIKHHIHGWAFTLPERPTVRQQLAYTSAAGFSGRLSMLERHWEGAKTIMADWSCEALPDTAVDLDELTNPTQAEAITWAGLQAAVHMNGIEDIPKNS